MTKKALIIISLMLISPIAIYALDESGRKAGKLAGEYVGNRYGTKSDLEMKANMPLTDSATQLSTLDSLQTGNVTSFCEGSEIKNQAKALEVTLNYTALQITTSFDWNGDGLLESSSTGGITLICREGFTSGTTYYQYQKTGSTITSVSVTSLDGCLDPNGVAPSYTGGKIAELYSAITGRTITGQVQKGGTVTYYSGEVHDCTGTAQDTSKTKYYDNPYQMESEAVSATVACSGSTSAECKAYEGLNNSVASVGGTASGLVSCSRERTITDSAAPQNGIICEANKIYYASGYSESNKYCQPGTRWDYSSQVKIRCNPYGKGLQFEGWAFWEGAPCGGSMANWPPADQVGNALSYAEITDTVFGNFSTNYRMGGPNTSPLDLSTDTRCYSDVLPLDVHISSTCAANESSCTYYVSVDNAPSCASFNIEVTPPAGQSISDGCSIYENNYDCDLKDESWEDANSNSIKMIRDGEATNNQPISTCKTYAQAGTVCKDWWIQERTYSCINSAGMQNPDITRATQVTDSTALSGADVTYSSPECSAPGANCVVSTWDQSTVMAENCEVACLIKRPAGAEKKGNSTYDWISPICTAIQSGQTTTYSCPLAPTDILVQNCGCIDTSSQAIGVMGAMEEMTKDRTCVN